MWHRAKRNHSTRIPGDVIILDTESYKRQVPGTSGEWEFPMRLCCARYLRMERGGATRVSTEVFRTPESVWGYIYSHANKERPLWLFAHNLGWDITTLRIWRELEEGRLSLLHPATRRSADEKSPLQKPKQNGLLVTADPPTMFSMWCWNGGKIKGVDTLNWFPFPLSKIGDTLGIPKLPQPEMSDADSLWTEYCLRDLDITAAAVLHLFAFIRDNDMGVFKYTPASQSLAFYKHGRMDCDWVIHSNRYVRSIERSAYYGGRNNVYFKGEVTCRDIFRLTADDDTSTALPAKYTPGVYALDMNAAYASVMRDNIYPNALVRVAREITPNRAKEYLASYCAVATVSIDSPAYAYPVRRGGHVIWATGRYKTALPGPELQTALDMGHVKHVHEMALYRGERMFRTFVVQILEMESHYKTQEMPLMVHLCKQIRNALHGKLGQHGYRWEVVPGEIAPQPWGQYGRCGPGEDDVEQRRAVGWQVQRLHTELDAPETSVAIAAYVTSYCRRVMRNMRNTAGWENVLYEDADTLHVTEDGYLFLDASDLIGDKPGQMRITDGPVDYACYHAPKDYIFGDKVVIGGLPRNAKRDENGIWWCDKFQRCNDFIARPPGKGPRVKYMQITRPLHALFAEPTATGWTKPIHLVEGLGGGDT